MGEGLAGNRLARDGLLQLGFADGYTVPVLAPDDVLVEKSALIDSAKVAAFEEPWVDTARVVTGAEQRGVGAAVGDGSSRD